MRQLRLYVIMLVIVLPYFQPTLAAGQNVPSRPGIIAQALPLGGGAGPLVAAMIIDAETGRPLARDQAFLIKTAVGEQSDEAGVFWLGGMVPGRHTLRIRIIGYEPEQLQLDLEPGGMTQVLVTIRRDTVELPGDIRLISPAQPRGSTREPWLTLPEAPPGGGGRRAAARWSTPWTRSANPPPSART